MPDFFECMGRAGTPRPLCVAVVQPDLPRMGSETAVAENSFVIERCTQAPLAFQASGRVIENRVPRPSRESIFTA